MQPLVVRLPILLEVGAHVEHWAADYATLPEEQRDQYSPQPTIAVQERMQRFELRVQNGKLHESIRLVTVEIRLPRTHRTPRTAWFPRGQTASAAARTAQRCAYDTTRDMGPLVDLASG